ncbi:MAG: hypothetical protein JXB50_09465 [Spirochaetes bacterium]|nr:hypothetical protein [Spirochaetota bacterium]
MTHFILINIDKAKKNNTRLLNNKKDPLKCINHDTFILLGKKIFYNV